MKQSDWPWYTCQRKHPCKTRIRQNPNATYVGHMCHDNTEQPLKQEKK